MGDTAPVVQQVQTGLEQISQGDWVNGGLAISDPFNLDPTTSFMEREFGEARRAGQTTKFTPAPPPSKDPTDAPKPEDARMSAFAEAKQSLRRRRLSSTLLTSGTGAIDAPSSASTVLLGS